MTCLIEDFVNRDPELSILWRTIQLERQQRIVLISGQSGLGKSYLLEECIARCTDEGISYVWVDFAESFDQTYIEIIHTVLRQIGAKHFARLKETLIDIRKEQEQVPRLSALSKPEHPPTLANRPDGRSGGVDFGGQAEVHGDVVGRDIYYITQIIHRGDHFDQENIQDQVTSAFQESLVEFTLTRTVVFLFDSWERLVATDTRNWLQHNLLYWILEKKLSHSVAVVAGTQVPDIRRLRLRVEKLTLSFLPNKAVQTYLAEKRGVPDDKKLGSLVEAAKGHPLVMSLLADLHAPSASLSN